MTNLLQRIYDFTSNEVTANVNNSKTTTDSLDDGTDGGAWETFREAGYDIGDDIWLSHTSHGAAVSTSSNAYANYALDNTETILQWDDLIGPNVQGRVVVWGRFDPSTDEIDLKIENLTDNEKMLEVTGITTTDNVRLGPLNYTPTTTDSPLRIVPKFRNGDNATSVTISALRFSFGFQI